MNLVSTLMQFLAPAIINKMAGSLGIGIGQGLAGKAITAAIPAILAGLAGSAGKSGGAAALASAIGRQDPGLLGNFASMLGGPGQQAMVNGGSSALSSLLGGGQSNALASAVGKFAGIDAGQSSSLMGMLAPVVLGQLGQVQKSQNLDAGGLASLLAGQKDNIASAMPPGFSSLLQGSGVLDSVSGSLKSAASAASSATMHAAPQASGGGIGKWVLPIALGVLGLYLLNNFGFNRDADKATATATATAPAAVTKPAETAPAAAPAAPKAEAPAAVAPKAEAPAVPAVPGMPAVGGDIVGIATKALAGVTQSLGTIKDVETAKAAIPGLTDTAKQIDGLKTAAALLTGDARKPLSMLIGSALPGITQAVDKAIGIPGAGELLKPVVEPMVANLTGLSK